MKASNNLSSTPCAYFFCAFKTVSDGEKLSPSSCRFIGSGFNVANQRSDLVKVHNFYKSERWKKKRLIILRRDRYECRECRRYGRVTVATTVHHIHSHEHYPELKLDTNNLLSLCSTCHNGMHDRVTNELTDKGFEWVMRARQNKI